MHTPTEHALLSPSASKRWLRCTGSIPLTQEMPDMAGKAAQEGTLAHDIFAHMIEGNRRPFDDLEEGEMKQALREAAAVVSGMTNTWPVFAVEHRVNVTYDCWGTADLVLWNGKSKQLHIVDLKYGQMSVEAEGNSQLQIYALGALKMLEGLDLRPTRIFGSIIQPRLDPVRRTAEYLIPDLRRMETRIKQVSDAVAQEDTVLEAGNHCHFCPALAHCPAYREWHQREAALAFGTVALADPDDVASLEEVAEQLSAFQKHEPWARKAKAVVKRALQEGNTVPGYKLDARGFLQRSKGGA